MMTAIWASGVLLGFLSLHCGGKAKKLLNICVFIAAVLFMSCNNLSTDETNLETAYYYLDDFNISSLLYSLLVVLFRSLGMDFGWFNFVMTAMALLLIANTLSLYTKSWGFALSLYLVSGAVLDVSLFRQFLASAFVVFGFRYLITQAPSLGKYMVCILLAFLIHFSMGLYLVFGILAMENKVRSRAYACMAWGTCSLAAAFTVFTLLNGRVIPGIQLVQQFVGGMDNHKLDGYISSASGRFGWLLPAMLWAISTLALHVLVPGKGTGQLDAVKVAARQIKKLLALSACFLPFCVMMAVVFSRLYRPLIWPMVMLMAMLAETVPRRVADARLTAGAVAYLGYYFLCYNGILFDWEVCTRMIFEGSLFWM